MCVYTCIIYICTQYNNCWMLQLSLHISSVECVWKETETERERGNDLGSCRLWDVFTSTRPRPFPAAPARFASSVCRIGTRGQQKSLKASSRFSSLFLRLFYLSVSFSLSKYPLYSIHTLTNIYIYRKILMHYSARIQSIQYVHIWIQILYIQKQQGHENRRKVSIENSRDGQTGQIVETISDVHAPFLLTLR